MIVIFFRGNPKEIVVSKSACCYLLFLRVKILTFLYKLLRNLFFIIYKIYYYDQDKALIMKAIQSRWCPDVTSIDHVSNDGECTDNDGYTE